MTNDVLATGASAVETARRLLLIWQDPDSRRLIRVGELDEFVDGHFAFRYLREAREPGFSPLVQFPELDQLYWSSRLPSFFAKSGDVPITRTVRRVQALDRAGGGWRRHTLRGADTHWGTPRH